MNDIFNMIITTIKYRFAAISAKLRYWTNTSFVKAKFLAKFSEWLKGLFNVKPRNKEDYYTFFNIMVSRKLVHAVTICVGLVCLGYLWTVRPFSIAANDMGVGKVYSYDDFWLKFQNATVSIKADAGYIAYTGQVKSGYAQGTGELFNAEGGVVYSGEFSKSMYEGMGKKYYPSGQLQYEGEFHQNLYNGSGKLYRENGIMLYSGEFVDGYQDGTGELYGNTGNKIFAGAFRKGELLYTQLLGKTMEEIRTLYTGSEKIYSHDEKNIVSLNGISALYIISDSDNSIANEVKTESVYVVRNEIVLGDKRIENIQQLKEQFGEPNFEGNSYVNFYDAVAIECGKDMGVEIEITSQIESIDLYEEYVQVNKYNKDALIYMYVYEIDGVNYSFVSEGDKENFFMYIISI